MHWLDLHKFSRHVVSLCVNKLISYVRLTIGNVRSESLVYVGVSLQIKGDLTGNLSTRNMTTNATNAQLCKRWHRDQVSQRLIILIVIKLSKKNENEKRTRYLWNSFHSFIWFISENICFQSGFNQSIISENYRWKKSSRKVFISLLMFISFYGICGA